MREFTLEFVRRSAPGRADRLAEARALLARLAASWRASAGSPLPDRFETLYRSVDAEIDSALGAAPVSVPCARGCDHCCRFNEILVSRYEAALLVRHIERLPDAQRADVVARIRVARGRSGGGPEGPCALLCAEGCSVYASRPLACRAYHSTSEPACRARLHGLAGDPPNLATTRVVEFAALDVARAAKDPIYEVNTLLARIYADPDKIARWAAGDAPEEPDLAIRLAR